MSRRAIPGNFFWGENSEKVIEIKKRGPFGLKFCHSIQTSIHHYKKINLRNWKDFSWENFYIVFFLFLGLNLEIWSSCRQLRAGCPNMFRRTNLGKLFCTRKEKKMAFQWHFSVLSAEPLVGVCQNTAFNTTKWANAGKNSEKVNTLYICFHAWRTKSCSFGAKPKQFVKSCPED